MGSLLMGWQLGLTAVCHSSAVSPHFTCAAEVNWTINWDWVVSFTCLVDRLMAVVAQFSMLSLQLSGVVNMAAVFQEQQRRPASMLRHFLSL